MKKIFLGPPGSGKGTAASRVAPKFKIPHISTGDLFRENIKNQTPEYFIQNTSKLIIYPITFRS